MGGLRVASDTVGVIDVLADFGVDNLYSLDGCRELTELLVSPSPGAHVLRLRATGEAFCLGRERGGTTVSDVATEAQVLADLMVAFSRTSLVTVAEVQGDAAGFGVGLVAACDVSVMAQGAHLWFPEISINLAPSLVLAWLARTVGRREAFWLTATGDRVDADRARELGLVNAVANDRDEVVTMTDDRVKRLLTGNARVHAEIKGLMRQFSSMSPEESLVASVSPLVVGSLRRDDH